MSLRRKLILETAPVTIAAQLAGQALDDESVIVRLTDEMTADAG